MATAAPAAAAGAQTLGTSGAAGPTPTAGGTGAVGSGTNPAGGSTGEEDALDRGVDQALGKAGHGQSRGTVEKISDGIRGVFKKLTGKDVPIQDKN